MATPDLTPTIVAAYRSILGRTPAPAEIAIWQAYADAGAGAGAIAPQIAPSIEASNIIATLYRVELGRDPDTGGLQNAQSALGGGLSQADLRAAIAQSDEERADVAAIYRAVLDRDPDEPGAASWRAAIGTTLSLADARLGIARSGEGQARLGRLYQDQLGRTADARGLDAFTNFLGAGHTIAEARNSIAHSAEEGQLIQSLYRTLLGHDADATGLAGAEARLAGGATLADVRAGIVASGTGSAPVLLARLVNDTGVSATDRITQDATVAGTETGGTLRASLDQGTAAPVTVAADGTFTLSTPQVAALSGGTVKPGSHVVHLIATGPGGSSAADVAFTFAIPAPVAFDLAAADQAGAAGQHHTQSSAVTLAGTTTPGETLTLTPFGTLASAQTTTADQTGAFGFAGVPVAPGANAVTISASDAAGPGASATVTITRDVVVQGSSNIVVQWDTAARAAVAQDASAAPVGARALAIESLAIFDTLNAIHGQKGYAVTLSATAGADAQAAVATAADTVLDVLYPAQAPAFDALLATTLAAIPDGQGKTDGIALGRAVALRELALRANDGSTAVPVFTGGAEIGQWRPTGPSFTPGLDPQYATVTPFALTSPDQFLPPPPPDLTSAAYAASVNKTQSLGLRTSTTRTADQTEIAKFWNDQTGTDTPPGQWNQIAATVLTSAGYSLVQSAKLFAELNVAEADAGIAAWNSKYGYEAWRPITAIELGGTGNAALIADPTWQPLLTTPNFPEYAEGHGSFSGAAATVLGNFFGDATSFSATSQSLNGVTRSYTSFTQAANEATESRIYGGIHFQFSADASLTLGNQVGAYVVKSFGSATTPPPPRLILNGTNAQSTRTDPTITGTLAGATGTNLKVTFDNGLSFSPVVTDATGQFAITPTYTTDGVHTVFLVATDPLAQVANGSFRFSLAGKGPTITLDATGLADGGTLAATSVLAGTVTPAVGTLLSALTYTLDNGVAHSIAFDPVTGSFGSVVDLFSTGIGAHTLVLAATDAAGNTTTNTLRLTMPTPVPFVVTALTPTVNATNIGVTYRPEVMFSRAADPATLTSASLYITDPSGAVVPTIIVALDGGRGAWFLPQGAFPGASKLIIHVDGSKIKAADGTPLDTSSFSAAGTQVLDPFTTASTAFVPGTSITGIVVDPGPDNTPLTPDDVSSTTGSSADFAHDTWKLPIAGVKVFVLGHEDQAVFTDATGHFTLSNVPAGDVKLAIDGRTATKAPAGFFFPELVHDLTILPGVVNTVGGSLGVQDVKVAEQSNPSVYIPRIHTDIFTKLSTTAPTVVHAPIDSAGSSGLNLTAKQIGQLSITVAPNSLLDANGNPVANAVVGISPVPSALIKDELPPGLEQHTFDITIQTPGGSVLTTPASLTFPNVFGLAAGEKTYLVSFNHTTGKLEIDGTGTVSADGETVSSDPGQGVIQPGWRGYLDPKLKTKIKTAVSPPDGNPKSLVNDYLGASDNVGKASLAATSYAASPFGIVNRIGGRLISAGGAIKGSPAAKAFVTGLGRYAPLSLGLAADGISLGADVKALKDQSSELTTRPVMGLADGLVNEVKVSLDLTIGGLDVVDTFAAGTGAGLPEAVAGEITKDTLNTVSLVINGLQLFGTFLGQVASDIDNVGNENPFGPRIDPTLVLHLSEDTYQGDAIVTISIDGVQVVGPTAITASQSLSGKFTRDYIVS